MTLMNSIQKPKRYANIDVISPVKRILVPVSNICLTGNFPRLRFKVFYTICNNCFRSSVLTEHQLRSNSYLMLFKTKAKTVRIPKFPESSVEFYSTPRHMTNVPGRSRERSKRLTFRSLTFQEHLTGLGWKSCLHDSSDVHTLQVLA